MSALTSKVAVVVGGASGIGAASQSGWQKKAHWPLTGRRAADVGAAVAS